MTETKSNLSGFSPVLSVGPHDHHPPRALPRLRGHHQAHGVARRPDGRRCVLHRYAALHQPAVQLWEPLPDLPADLQAAPPGEGKAAS